MKKIKILLVLIGAVLGFNSCEKDELVFTAQEPSGTFSFTNTFLDQYILTTATSSNIGERFTWNSVSFDTPTAVSYDLEGSVSSDFSTISLTKSTSGNDVAVTIGNLLAMAAEAGLDNDPNTESPDTGMVYFRLRAYAGNDAIETISTVQSLTLVLPEIVSPGNGFAISTWGVVGSGYNNWGDGGKDGVFYTTDQNGVLVAYVTLVTGEIKFRENNDWTVNLGDNGADGTLEQDGSNIAVTAGTYKITFDTNDNTYTIEPYTWGVVGSATPNQWDGPDLKFYYDYTTDTFKAGVKLAAGDIKFRFNNQWAINYGDDGVDGTLDQDGANITVTAGYYVISLDINNGTYTMEAGDVWGVVGSAAVNGWDGPDFNLTEINPGIVFGEFVSLTSSGDPQNPNTIKFRINDAWATNLGDDGTGHLVQDGGNIPVNETGDYRVYINLNDSTYWIGKIQ